MTAEMRVQLAQGSEALDDVGTHRTNQLPVHVEQPGHAAVEKEIDRLAFRNRFLGGELDRIDAVERLVRARAQQRLQPRDDPRTPGFGRFERDQALFELFFIDHRMTSARKTAIILVRPFASINPDEPDYRHRPCRNWVKAGPLS